MSKNLRDYTKTLYALDAVVNRVAGDDWDKQSPNEEWSARETLGHVIWGMRRIAAAINNEPEPAEQAEADVAGSDPVGSCLLYTSPSPRDGLLSRMPSSA